MDKYKEQFEVHDHDAVQVALGYLCVPDEIEKEDLELLNQSHKIFEDEYVKYFEDAKAESHIARYSELRHTLREDLKKYLRMQGNLLLKSH